MIFLTKSRQRRDRMVRQMAEVVSTPPADDAFPASDDASARPRDIPAENDRQALAAWTAMAVFLAIPVTVLLVLLNS